jgi:hypothetical protein
VKWLFFAKLKSRGSFGSDMDIPMASTAKLYEIFFHIPSQLTSRLHMMNLKFLGTSASFASPAIALNNTLTKSPIGMPVQAKSRLSGDG